MFTKVFNIDRRAGFAGSRDFMGSIISMENAFDTKMSDDTAVRLITVKDAIDAIKRFKNRIWIFIL